MTESIVRRQDGMDSYIMGVLSYMGILCFVPLMFRPKDEFIRFHARQGLVLWMWSMLAILSLLVPGIGKLIFSSSAMIIAAATIIGVLSVLLGRAWKLPFIHAIAGKI